MHAQKEQEKHDWMELLRQVSSGSAAVEIEEKLRREQYDIPSADLEWGSGPTDILGKGASGVVKKGRWLKTTDVAIKALNNLPEFTDSRETTSFFKEIEMLRQTIQKQTNRILILLRLFSNFC